VGAVTITDARRYVPRHADEASGVAADPAVAPADGDAGWATRDHALALIESSPVYARVARLLGVAGVPARRGGPCFQTEIAARLALLPAGWHRLQPLGAAVEHVVLGPPGVFMICVRHHPEARVSVRDDTVKVNGRGTSHVRDAREQADRAAALLTEVAGSPVPVRGVVAVMGAHRGFVVRSQPRDVTVVTRRTITAFLHSLPPVLDPGTVDLLAAVAGRALDVR
jgi:hypothetical protein